MSKPPAEEFDADTYWVAFIENVQFDVMAALGAGAREVTLRLSTLQAIALLDEMMDRRPRNFSMLLRDHTVARLNTSIERMIEAADSVERAAFVLAHASGRKLT